MITDCKRTRRVNAGRARVTPRELLALQFIAHAQPVTTGQYRELLGLSVTVAHRSLRKLKNLGVVTAWVTAVEECNRYTLGPKAPPALARVLGCEKVEFRVPRGLGKTNLPHHEAVLDLYVALKVACARSKTWELVQFLMERQIRAATGAQKGALHPDGVAVLRDRGGELQALVLEADLGTENPSLVAKKAAGYARLKEMGREVAGCRRWSVLCTTPTARRRNRLALSTWAAEVPEGLWYFAAASAVSSSSVLLAPWWTVRLDDTGEVARLVQESPVEAGRTGWQNGSAGQTTPVSSDFNNLRHDAGRPFTSEDV